MAEMRKSEAETNSYAAPRAIRVERRGEAPFELTIYPDSVYSFGRDRSCTVVFADDSVSRDHGLLACRADGYWVYRDRGSSNGSYLSEQLDAPESVESVSRLQPGRAYRVGAGQAVVLGNASGRICFLAEPVRHEDRPGARASAPSLQLEQDIGRNARHRGPVFLLGPTGSGKTWAARRIHDLSGVEGNFVLVDCGSLPRDLNSLRSELLGHVRGAFSDAREARLGKLHHADGGTLFLDEVESLSPEAQGLLLNLIDGTGDFTPLGQAADVEQKRPRFRLISASKVPLRRSNLREDLCNRLARGGIVILPTLEQRRADIPALVKQLTSTLNQELLLDARFDSSAIKLLQAAEWPGHVRELEGVVRTVMELECVDGAGDSLARTGMFKKVDGNTVGLSRATPQIVISAASVRRHLEQHQLALGEAPRPLAASAVPVASGATKRPQHYSADELRNALELHSYNITHSAVALGVAPNTLKRLMRQHQLVRPSRAGRSQRL